MILVKSNHSCLRVRHHIIQRTNSCLPPLPISTSTEKIQVFAFPLQQLLTASLLLIPLMASSLDFVSFSLSNSSNRFRILCFLFLYYVCLFASDPPKCCLVLLRHPCQGQRYVREDERDYKLYRLCVHVKLPSAQPNVLYVHIEGP
jgi:hypothetical protein